MNPLRSVAALAFALVAAVTAASPTAAAEGDAYVALGDSYAAGVGIPSQYAGSCERSTRNYAHLSAEAGGLALTDLTCGGATIESVRATQLGALTADTRVVSLTVGGNDTLFNDISTCISAHVTNIFAWSPCRDRLGDQLQDRIDAAAGNLGSLIREIRVQAPQAKVLLVGYPRVLPENAWSCQFNQPVAVGDVHYLRGAQVALNSMISDQAQANGAEYVDTYTSTDGHDICQPNEKRWVEGVLVVNGSGKSFHPNQYGQQAMASRVTAALD